MDTYFNIYVTHVVEAIDCQEIPNYSNLIFWGQKEREISVKLQDNLNAFNLHSCPIPTVNDLKKDKLIFCVEVNSTWLRATINKDHAYHTIDRNGVDVFCIDYGLAQNVPLDFIRLIPPDAVFVKECPPLATKFLLGDVVVEKGHYGKEPVLQYLKVNVENKLVKAVSLGHHGGFEGVRVYLKDVLLAKLLVEKGMGFAGGSYSEALQKPVPIHSYFSVASVTTPVKSTNVLGLGTHTGLQTNPSLVNAAQHQTQLSGTRTYMASTLEANTNHLVIVTHVQNGPEKFTIQLKSAEADRKLALISHQLAAFADNSLVKLSDPARGVPCIAVSSRDKMFHRGLITQKDDSKFANVYFVDFGFSELIDQELLFEIPDYIIAIELHAIRVSLAEADTLAGLKGVSEVFTKTVLNKVFTCQVVSYSAPLSIVLIDESGRSVKDIILESMSSADATVSPTLSLNIPLANIPSAASPSTSFVRADLKVNPVEVEPEEKLFVTYVGPPGQFFGQFEKRPQADLKEMENELFSVYSKCSNLLTTSDIPLLYADVKCHLGDYAVIKWSNDGNLYRVKIAREDVNYVAVDFIDYGNSIRVPRRELWAPVKGLKLFCQPPFGIQCLVAGVNITADQWEKSLAEKSIVVKLKPGIDGVYPAILANNIFDVKLNNVKKVSSCLSPEAPVWVPPTGNNVEPSNPKAVRQLFDKENTFRSALTEVTPLVPTTMLTQSRAPSSCSTNSADSKFAGTPSIKVNCAGARSTISNASQTVSERTERDFDRVEDKMSPKRNLPIAKPATLFYPAQPRLEGAVKELEVVFVENPNSFYCQLTEATPPLDALMTDLDTAYSDGSKPCLIGAKKGVACVAQYTLDNAWYRGEVLDIEETEVDILFVDYGNQQRTPINLVKAIEETFVALPHQAYYCSLSGVPNDRSWTTEEKVKFEEVAMGKSLTATFASHRVNDKYPVQLAENRPGSPLVINELFGALTRTAVPPPHTGYSNLPIHSTPIEVNVAWFYNAERFFLSPVDLGPYQEELGDLEKFYSSLSSNELVEDEPRVGMPCVVRFMEDGLYYRSQILAVRDQMAKVIFVDYGNEQNTPFKELKRIHPSFMKCPQLTWHCKLKDVKLATNLPADVKQHIDTCFLTGEIIEALLHPPTDSVYDVELKIPQIGNATAYLLKHKVVESTIQPEKDVVLAPQDLDFSTDKTLSVNAVIPFVESPIEFWIQLNSEAVDRFMERVDKLVLEPEFINKKGFVPSIGKPCLAFYAEDGRWYRATVRTVDGGCCTVFYIDYGNCSSVDIAHLKDLPEDLAKIPALAFKCCLDGAENVTEQVTEAFKNEVLDLIATVKFVQTVDGILHVRLFNADGVDLNEKIGLAKSKAKEMEVYVAYAVSPSCFWIQRKQDEDLVYQIQEKLCELDGSNAESFRLSGRPVVGQIYAVPHPEYSTWYRAELKSIANNSAEIQFIDYGDTHPVPLTKFCTLPGDLNSIPPLAIHCSLNVNPGLQKWSENEGALKYFINACPPDVVCRVVLGSKDSNNIQLIDSMLTGEGYAEDVVETLVSKIQSSHSKNIDDVVDLLESVSISISKKSILSAEQPTIPSSREWIRDSTPGQVISTKGSAVCIPSALAVWIQLNPSLADAIVDSIQEYVKSPEFANSIPPQPFVGCFCLALFSEDQQWYRAVVEAVNPDSIMVKYVDYGNSSPTGLEHIRMLPTSLMTQPALALKCALDGADPNSSALPDCLDCQNVIFNQTLTVTLVEKTPDYVTVRLRDEQGNDLNGKLGLAVSVNQDTRKNASALPSVKPNIRAIPNSEEVVVSYVKSASMFWIHRKSDEEVIEQIRDNLRPLDGESASNEEHVNVKVGELYAVMHPEYNRYYRARVDRILGEEIEVFFLDYGHTLWAPMTNVRPCPALLKYIPPMATECTFRTPIHPDQFSEEIQKTFMQATEGVMCQAVFCGPQPAKGVHTVEALYAKGVEVVALLSKSCSKPAAQADNNLPLFSNQQRQRGL